MAVPEKKNNRVETKQELVIQLCMRLHEGHND